MVLLRKYHNLIELRQIRQEVIHTRPFRRSPTVHSLNSEQDQFEIILIFSDSPKGHEFGARGDENRGMNDG